MVITPQTNIKLLKVPICLDEKNQITFGSRTAQYNYFNSLPKLEFDSCTYQRKDNYMAINEDADTLQEYNYCMYQNEQYGDKWFYAFITDISYQGNNVSYVTIKTDVYQTWLFECNFKRSFVEREHTNNDTIGANTIPENVELGEYINVSEPTTSNIGNNSYICCAIAKNGLIPEGAINSVGNYNGIISGLTYLILKDLNSVDSLIYHYTNTTYVNVDDIISFFMIPAELVQSSITWLTIPNTQGEYAYVSTSTSAKLMNIVNINVPSVIGNNYTPVNNKLLTYPYRCLVASNGTGTDVVYNYEDFLYFNGSPVGLCNFDIYGSLSQGCSIKYIPKDYKGVSLNIDEGLNCGKFPIGSWTKDSYNVWLRQNAVNMGINNLIGEAKIIGGIGSLALGQPLLGGGLIASGIEAVSDSVIEKYNHRAIPNQIEGNINSSDILFSMKRLGITFYHKSIKNEYARVIDNYFSMFGYKTNRVKKPNLTGRRNWNYVKTINANVEGNIPQKDLQEIKNMFDRGVTLWHNPSTFLDYSQNNAII